MRISQAAVALVAVALVAAPRMAQGDVQVEKWTLYLQPGGTALLRTDLDVRLSKGLNVLAPLPVPSYVTLEKLSVRFPGNEADVTLSEVELQRDGPDKPAKTGSQRLVIVAESRIRGQAGLSLVYPAKGLRWSAGNECKLPTGNEMGYLSLRLSFANESDTALVDMRVLVPESGQASGGAVRDRPEPALSSATARIAPMGATEPAPLYYGVSLFALDRQLSIEAGGRKSVVLGKWPVSQLPSYFEIKTTFSGGRPTPDPCITDSQSWRQVSTAARTVLRLAPAADAEPPRLLPGKVLLTNYGETSITYLEAEGWSKQDNVILVSWGADQVSVQRSQRSFQEIYRGRACTERIALTLRNATDMTQQVKVQEPLFRSAKFAVVSASAPYNISTDGAIEFRLDIEPKQEASIEYEIRYDTP